MTLTETGFQFLTSTNLIWALCLGALFRLGVEWLNLRAVGQPLPETLQDVYDHTTYKKSQRYANEKFYLQTVEQLLGLLLLCGFIWFEVFGHLDQWASRLAQQTLTPDQAGPAPLATSLGFFGILFLGQAFLSLPFQVYHHFSLEQRYGFNQMTWKTFMSDQVKGLFLALLLGLPLLTALLLFLEHFPLTGWLLMWGTLTLLQTFLIYVAPIWILPLFNKFELLPAGPLREQLTQVAQRVHFPLEEIYTMDASKRSSKANAFFTGFGRHRRIVLFDTLVTKLSAQQVTAVLAHELGHWKLGHIRRQFFRGILSSGLLLCSLNFLIRWNALQGALGFQNFSLHAGLLGATLAFGPISFFLSAATNWFSRKYEFEADAFANAQVGTPRDLILGLKILSRESLSLLTPHPLKVFLDYSHPPLAQRIEALHGAPNSTKVFG